MITIYGYSDDLVEVEGLGTDLEFNVYDEHWQGDLVAPGGSVAESMRVHCWYGDSGCWQVGVGQTDESAQLPPWPVTIAQKPHDDPGSPGYSALLSIDAPEGTTLTNVKPEPEGDEED